MAQSSAPARPAKAAGVGERYRLLPAATSADELEQEMLDLWRRERLFERALTEAEGRPEFIFFEGPPTANGQPGLHHVFSRTVKDLFCRHRAMRGFHVTRKAGWDTHGLPVEIEVEKELGISGKQQIEEIGVEEFNRRCRESVFTYRDEWERLSERIGFWLDYENAYATLNPDYVESVWWALKTLHDRGFLYRGHKILPYCPRCGTALSSHEVAQGYKTVPDPSVYVALPSARDPSRRFLVWTTTPWTLVSNVALAVHPDAEYVELRRRKRNEVGTIVLARSRVPNVLGADFGDRWETVAVTRGSELAGESYQRPFDWVEFPAGKHELIVAEEFVTADDGTGIVHMAPAFGADDYAAARRNDLAFLQPVNARGEFEAGVPLVAGRFVKDADVALVDDLKRRGLLWKAATIEHKYPHCWRCETPLFYFARTSWFVRTTAFREAMLARNSRVDWHPEEVGTGRFGDWLTDNVDWAISRDRYWGTPLPIWICDKNSEHVEVLGAYADLFKRSGTRRPDSFDPHKPYIDKYQWKCGQCGGTMSRVGEVLDTWFDSGSMPFAQWHFPFENRELMERHYPADFIAEGVDQTRGWFYSLLAIATGLGDALPNNQLAHETAGGVDTAPYRAVVVNGVLQDAEGQKMSKSRGNVIEPWALIEKYGADAVRLALLTSSQVDEDRAFTETFVRESCGPFFLNLRNVYSGIFAQYANFGWAPSTQDPASASRPLIDRWALSRLRSVEREADALLRAYDATAAARLVTTFLVNDVSNWYVRLNRHRFYDVDGSDNKAAFATLHEILASVCRMMAPFAPFLSDFVHRELTGGSVHLVVQGSAGTGEVDIFLERSMEAARVLVRLGRSAREEAGTKVRQPLSRMVCVVPRDVRDGCEALLPLIASELNVKRVELASSADALVQLEARANFRTLGKRFGRATPAAAAAVAALGGDALLRIERGEEVFVVVGGQSYAVTADDVTIVRRAAGDLVVKAEGEYFAAIDPEVTAELRAEGLARELVSRVQRLRKESNFAVSDRIRLAVWGEPELEDAARAHAAWIAEEVLARELIVGEPRNGENPVTVDLDGVAASVALTRLG